MRPWLILIAVLVAAPATAAPIQYSFVGTLGRTSSLTRGDGTVVDLSGSAFTASGTATGDLAVAEGWTHSVFLATTTYDFGVLGAFTTNLDDDRYVQFAAADGTATLGLQPHIRLGALNDGKGLMAYGVATEPIVDHAVLTTTDGAVALSYRGTVGSQTRQISNSLGDVFRLAYDPMGPLTLTSVNVKYFAPLDVQADPEPASQVLLAVSGCLLLRRRHGRGSCGDLAKRHQNRPLHRQS